MLEPIFTVGSSYLKAYWMCQVHFLNRDGD